MKNIISSEEFNGYPIQRKKLLEGTLVKYSDNTYYEVSKKGNLKKVNVVVTNDPKTNLAMVRYLD